MLLIGDGHLPLAYYAKALVESYGGREMAVDRMKGDNTQCGRSTNLLPAIKK